MSAASSQAAPLDGARAGVTSPDGVDDARPTRTVRLDATRNRTYHYWHAFVPSVRPGQLYGYRVEGPLDPARGLCFDPGKVLLDPYGRGVAVPEPYSREAAARFGHDTTATAMKSVVVDPRAYDWEGDAPLRPIDEFRDMVKALHRAGLEVILDVVFNHTAEGGHDGPTLSFRGLDNHAYYILVDGGARYADYSGCGNTLNANHPIVRRMIVDSLRYWVEEMHVDGFRFDLASILARDPSGQVLANPPVLLDIESDPALAGIKFMAEAWDASGLYQVGSFVGEAWKEWNGRFRDDVRAFFHGEDGMVGRFADRLVGSPELYAHKQREPEQSVNFVTCHDGFTLNDLVSYDRKHNEANRENNRDGGDDNKSWNCGVEGPTDDRAVERLRNRHVKNFLATTLLSIGLPMILMGDEVRRTQDGNNNLYCHDDERAWFDWTLLDRHRDVHRFVSLLNARRVLRSVRHEEQRLSLAQLIAQANKAWHGVALGHADWSRGSHSLAFGAELKDERRLAHFIFNAYWEPLVFELPAVPSGKPWRRWIDTALESPDDIAPWQQAPPIPGHSYRAEARSVAVLFADLG